ncbi:MAG: hypothetical protein FGM23_01625 [Alphaproteobacteria bacterium]|jgi:hypothetical protein|nr:hypothetical protein [Alphaproteobacteria bacterium]
MSETNSPSQCHSQSFPRDEFGYVNDEFGCVNVSAGSVIDLEEGIQVISSLPDPERSQYYPQEEFVAPPLGAVNVGR